MNTAFAKKFIENKDIQKSVFGLETIAELLKRLDNPQNKIKVVHVAGTNGKGSVIAFINRVLINAGLKVGAYTSPSLFDFKEIVRINNKKISSNDFAFFLTLIKNEIIKMTADGFSHPTRFEIETALAYLYFSKNNCDIALIETGLGGKLDATNVVKKPVLEIITFVDFDHMQHLGNTLKEIAAHKAGIIKPDTAVVSIKQNFDVISEVENACRLKNCKLILADERRIFDLKYSLNGTSFCYKAQNGSLFEAEIKLLGAHQPANAIIAIEALEVLKAHCNIAKSQICSGLKSAKWFGRFTVLCKNPVFILDGAHNVSAAKALKKSVELYFKDKNITFIFGVFSDKDYSGILRETAHLAKKIITIETLSGRALSQNILIKEVTKYNSNAYPAKSIEDAVKQSFKNADKNDVIIAFGSLSILQEIKKAYKELK